MAPCPTPISRSVSPTSRRRPRRARAWKRPTPHCTPNSPPTCPARSPPGTGCGARWIAGARWCICASPRTPRTRPPRQAREYADALAPVVTGHEVAMKRRLLATPGVAALAGAHAMRLWETDVTTFDPAIAARPRGGEPARPPATQRCWPSAKVTIDGEETNLAGLGAVCRERGPRDAAPGGAGTLGLLRRPRRGAGRALRRTGRGCGTAWPASSASTATRRSATAACAGWITARRTWRATATRWRRTWCRWWRG